MPYINTPPRTEDEIIKVHVSNMKHVSTNELERKLKEKEIGLIRLLGEEENLRSEQT